MAEAKRNSLKKVDSEKMALGVYFATFTDGQTFAADIRELRDESGNPFDFDAQPPMVQRVLSYGLKQKLDDAQAGVEDIDEALDELKSTWEAIVAGKWTIRVPGEGVEGGLFARALAEVKGIPLSDAKAKIAMLVERNVEANQKAAKTEEEKQAITERRVLNSIRTAMLERDEALGAKYKELQEAHKAKQKAKPGLPVDTSLE